MQVTPALPWNEETFGGEIQLAEPVSFQELLDGALVFLIGNDEEVSYALGNEGSSGYVVKEKTSGIVLYQIARFDGESNRLNLTKENSLGGWSLFDVHLYEGEESYPQLPLQQVGHFTKMGEILLRGSTVNSLVNGEYVFVLESNGERVNASIVAATQQMNGLDFMIDGSVVMRGVISLDSILTLYSTEDGGPSLVEIYKS